MEGKGRFLENFLEKKALVEGKAAFLMLVFLSFPLIRDYNPSETTETTETTETSPVKLLATATI